MPQNLDDFLRQLGFIGHPFAWKAAEQEEALPEYFVPGVYFYRILGSLNQTTPKVFFAPRGNGKSTNARMIDYLLTQTSQPEPVVVVNLRREELAQVLETVEGDLQKLQPRHYREKLAELSLYAFQQQFLRLKNYPGVTELVLPATPLKLKELVEALHQSGVWGIYFLIDGVDELPLTVANITNAARLIEPLLADLTSLEAPHTIFKFFLPLEIEEVLRSNGQVRFDRLDAYSTDWQWKEADLLELLQQRLDYFSASAFNSLSTISDVADIDQQMCKVAAGSPRNLIRLGNYLLEHSVRLNEQERKVRFIRREALELAVRQLQKELGYEESYRSGFLNKLTVLPELELVKSSEPIQSQSQAICVIGSDVYIDGNRLEPAPGGLEFKLLKYLYQYRGQTCDKLSLIQELYNQNNLDFGSEEQLNATVRRLRLKLNKANPQYYIQTVRRVGLRLINYQEPPNLTGLSNLSR